MKKNEWSYYNFLLPLARSNKSKPTKKAIILLIFQFIATMFLWTLIQSYIGDSSGFNSHGMIPNTISDLSVFLIWFAMARLSWHFYHL